MNDAELLTAIKSAKSNAETYNSELMMDNDKYNISYKALKEGDFAAVSEHQSSAVSSDVFDTIESDMPSIARIFLGSGDIISFKPNSKNPVDVKEAEQKTKYVNWVVKNQDDSFNLMFSWFKSAGINKNAVVKYFCEEKKDVELVEYEGVSAEEVEEIKESLKGAEVDKVKVEIDAQSEDEKTQTFNIKFRVTREDKIIKIVNILPNHFRITEGETSIDDAELVGDSSPITRGDLVAQGYPRELVAKLNEVSLQQSDREGYKSKLGRITDWASEYVEDSDLYIRVDYDGDGIAERRRIRMSGDVILENEYYNHTPYASLSAIAIPYSSIGMSRAEAVYETQRQKTSLLRATFNNIHAVGEPRNVIHSDIDLDDMLTRRSDSVVRLDSDSKILPSQAVFPLVVPYVGDKTMQVMQYVDHMRSQKTGVLLSNQGLDYDKISNETAARFNGIKDSGDAKVELMVRNYAETGVKKLFEGIAWTASRYQNTEVETLVLGEELSVKPTSWKYNHKVEAKVGLGAGDNERLVEARQGIYSIQQQLKQAQSPIVDDEGIYKNLIGITEGLGFNSSERLFNNPLEPEELLRSQNEQLNNMVLQMQEQISSLQNPLAEAETIKREGDIAIAQGKLALDAAELAEKQRQFDIKTAQSQNQFNKKTAVDITKIEVENNKDIEGGI